MKEILKNPMIILFIIEVIGIAILGGLIGWQNKKRLVVAPTNQVIT